jgi:hypothetical protein
VSGGRAARPASPAPARAKVLSMAAASPINPRRSELDVAVDKIRAGEPLTERERALVNRRGEELIAADLTGEPPPGTEPFETTPEEDEALLEDEVLAEADARQGLRGTPWREWFAARGIPVPPARG